MSRESSSRRRSTRFQEVIGIDARLVKVLLQKVALWETSQDEENRERTFKLYLNRLLLLKN